MGPRSKVWLAGVSQPRGGYISPRRPMNPYYQGFKLVNAFKMFK